MARGPARRLGLLALLAASAGAAPAVVYVLPPVRSLREAGKLHGERAARQIRGFLQTPEISSLRASARMRLRSAFLSLRARATAFSPALAEELAGLAEGAGVELDDVWAVNLISELEHLGRAGRGHCSDVMARAAPGGPLWHGHNEDWSKAFAPFLYWVVYNAGPRATFRPIGGLVYPGQSPGFAVAFTPSVWTTQNALFPVGMNSSGIPIVAVALEALQAERPEEAARRFALPGQALGMNVNVAGAGAGAYAADVEVAGAANLAQVAEVAGNATHFNVYKHLMVPQTSASRASSSHRQAAADRRPAPRSAEDVLALLGDTGDRELPVYRPTTMASVLFSSDGGRFQAWHGANPSKAAPDWESSLDQVFQHSASGDEVLLVA